VHSAAENSAAQTGLAAVAPVGSIGELVDISSKNAGNLPSTSFILMGSDQLYVYLFHELGVFDMGGPSSTLKNLPVPGE
jgi:hypothetical protein